MYFRQSSQAKDWDALAGVLNFDLYECTLETNESNLTFLITIKGSKKAFLFRCECREELVMWTQALTQSLQKS